jgi:hypothetical protein
VPPPKNAEFSVTRGTDAAPSNEGKERCIVSSTTMAVSVANPRRIRYEHIDTAVTAAESTAASQHDDREPAPAG